MSAPEPILVAKAAVEIFLLPAMANRHGLIAGATGTGKTVTLQVLAESFSQMGVPVFMADVKGDLAGLSQPGTATPKTQERLSLLKLDGFTFSGCPVTFWDVLERMGIRFAPRFRRWGHCSSRACFCSMRPSPVCSTWSFASPTNRGCCSWI